MEARLAPQTLWRLLTRPLPVGGGLAEGAWQRRHRGMLLLLSLQSAGLALAAASAGAASTATVAFWAVIAGAVAIGLAPALERKWRTSAVAVGLLAGSAFLVHLTGGLTESHFHFFVMLAVITLYQDWFPFLVAFGGVLAHHTILGLAAPEAVFSHPSAAAQPLRWILLHGLYVLLASAANVLAWRLGERERTRAELLLNSTAEGIYGVDTSGRITFANDAACHMVARRPDDLVGVHHHEAFGHGHNSPGQAQADDCRVCQAVTAGRVTRSDSARLQRADGGTIPVDYASALLWDKDRVTGSVVTFRDCTERTRLAQQALHDELTGLPNRTLMREHMSRALVALDRRRSRVAVLFCDLDRFKTVNDAMGHAAGDELLVAAGRRLQAAVRAHDTVARFGGDEFVLLCTDLDSEHDAAVITERILASFARPFRIQGTNVQVSTSVGITVTDDPHADADTLLCQADAAMYRAKQAGRDRVEMFDGQLRARTDRRLRIENDLRVAVATGQLRVHYQPKVAVADGRLRGVEALVRWQHPRLGLVAPSEFLAVAEDCGLIVDIGQWVLEEGCRQLQAWRRAYPEFDDLTLSVNVSARQLRTADLPQRVADVLERTGMPASALCLEISEQVLMQDTPATVETLLALKRLGAVLAVDDFGTAWTSVSYLTRIPVDVLKVDRSHISALDAGDEGWAVVAAAIGLSRALGLSTVAEGVERDSQAAVLRGLGCDLAQGYHFARPTPARELEGLLRAGTSADLGKRIRQDRAPLIQH